MTTQAEWQATTQAQWLATVCTIDGCERKRHGVFHTYCRTCYEKSRREKNAKLAPLGFGKRCTIADCGRPHHATGLCRLHYNRKITTGSTELKPKAEPKPKPLCAVDGCAKEAKSLGYCSSHYSNYRRHGVAVVPNMRGARDEPLLDKFARRIEVDDELGCWLWTGMLNDDFYGRFYAGPERGEIRAHRWIYEQLTGRVLTPDMQLDHDCIGWDNDPKRKKCVRPSHLLLVDQEQHTKNTAARRAVPEGFHHKLDDRARSWDEVAYAIKHNLPMVWNK